jgi:hypothetical protein
MHLGTALAAVGVGCGLKCGTLEATCAAAGYAAFATAAIGTGVDAAKVVEKERLGVALAPTFWATSAE